MSIPRKHHYVPAFYLKQWIGADGRLCEHKRVYGKVAPRKTSPDGTGYQKDLYRADGLPEEEANRLESKFMHMLDTRACLAHQKLLSGDNTPWDEPKRSAWSRFIMSFLFRNPEAVNTLIGHIVELWGIGIEALEDSYTQERKSADPATLKEFLESKNPSVPQMDAANFLASAIDNERIGQAIFEMKWSVIDLRHSYFSLLTSDRPIDMPLGLGDKQAYIALPISPYRLFIVSKDGSLPKSLRNVKASDVARRMNKTVVTQARTFVWGICDSQLTFIERHIGKAPDRELITDAQKQQGIDAAKGLQSEILQKPA